MKSQNHGWCWFVEIFPALCQQRNVQEKQAYVQAFTDYGVAASGQCQESANLEPLRYSCVEVNAPPPPPCA